MLAFLMQFLICAETIPAWCSEKETT